MTDCIPRIADLVGFAPGEGGASLARGIALADEPGIGAQTIPGYLAELVARHGPAEAVVLNAGGARIAWSYDDLGARAAEVARALIATGHGKGERVGLLMTNRPEFLSGLFGIALAGGVAVALSTFSTPGELAYLLEASAVSTLLFEARVAKTDFAAMLVDLEPAIATARAGALRSLRFPFLTRLVALDAVAPGGVAGAPHRVDTGGAIEGWEAFVGHGRDVAQALVEARRATVVPGDPGGIFFSSGTTGNPKGIVHEQRSFAIQWWRWPRVFAMREPVRAWTGNGFFWSGNVSMVVGSALSTGGTVVLQRFFEPDEALRLIAGERVSFANGRPHQWARLRSAAGWAAADLSSLRHATYNELLRDHPGFSSDWHLPMSFGTTETMSICTSLSADYPPEAYQGSFGVPLPGNTLKIVDPETRAILPVGAIGETCIKGPTLMSGYLGKTSEQCFDAEGFYATGDGGSLDAQGRYFWAGRLTDMIKTGGANVAPEEIDRLVANWPGVKRCQTVGVADALLGEKVVTCIVPVDGHAIDTAALGEFLKSRLASFKQPRRILVCSEADFALTGNEKIKSAAIRALAERRLAGAAD
ncbi:MAG: acyl--CoA ligase [Sphingomonadales bacterium]|nr:acyl--CoA ligase [Sphingomonadales bacterium]